MYQNLYKLKQIKRYASLFGLALFVSACHQSCGGHFEESGDYRTSAAAPDGLVVGAVVNAPGRPALESYERWRYADQLASHILAKNPELSGSIDSYEYLSKRVGKPFGSLIQSYRLEGDLSSRALESFRSAELRRPYLMLVSILPEEQSFPLKPDVEPVVGRLNPDVQDYYYQNLQTILLTGVRVQVFDTRKGRKITDEIVRSDEGGRMLATENRARSYVGNSVVATITNTLANVLTGAAQSVQPPPPKRDDVLAGIWGSIAEKLPAEVF